jgi:Epoxide hydrolase N terminus
MAVTTERSAGAAAIRPFTVELPEADVEDLRARIRATRFPEREPVEEPIVHPLGDNVPPQGVELATMEALVRYWGTEYDLRRVETRLNALPQFLTEIDDLDIHFIHVKSRHENALPMILVHGWPGSVVELLSVVGRLTDPTAHGGSAEDAFDVVIPSIPGYGFSGKPTTR